ncbi:gas vesicle protein GvpO [Desulfoscipio geothermicus]|uniref:Gas vesicle synthesis protein GvpO n=1 Tax=Desulfoscipio geothermicus DSM 3669 TaxID=1121426 RepID=A0A1I6CZW3_9FIRM|nr:gas vesicle protein GvpO [Desulfoscipio geothermicus]SFQ98597.1 Gas vesicle synthesis protein GvpO [Desulfoscipio geothermicus DSM 3669]
MNIIEVVSTVEKFFSDVLKRPGVIVGILRDQDLWKVQIEVAEEVEYMRKRAQDDLLAMYEVTVNNDLEILAFERKYLRERDSTDIGKT